MGDEDDGVWLVWAPFQRKEAYQYHLLTYLVIMYN